LTMQIVQELQNALGTKDCLRYWREHLCVNSRGISDIESSTVTWIGGKFKDPQARREFLDYIKLETKF
jgi:GTP cyclohydrolase I